MCSCCILKNPFDLKHNFRLLNPECGDAVVSYLIIPQSIYLQKISLN